MASTVCLVMSPMLISIFPIRRVYRHGWQTCHTAARPHTAIERAAFWIVLGSRHIHHSERSAVREAPLKPAASLHVERSRRRKTGQVRIDAHNVLNHPEPQTPNSNIKAPPRRLAQ